MNQNCIESKISELQKWADWAAQAGSKKLAENQETFRLKRNFQISKKLAELTSKKLTSGSECSIFQTELVSAGMQMQGAHITCCSPFTRHLLQSVSRGRAHGNYGNWPPERNLSDSNISRVRRLLPLPQLKVK